jgi:hypothetical protein
MVSHLLVLAGAFLKSSLKWVDGEIEQTLLRELKTCD